MPDGLPWVRIKGDGLAVQGRCNLHGVIFWPDANGDHVDIYDGLDAVGGKKFCRIESAYQITWQYRLAHPVEFANGIYVDGIDSAVETTVIFEQLD